VEGARQFCGSDGNLVVHGHKYDAWNGFGAGKPSGHAHRELQTPAMSSRAISRTVIDETMNESL
jgi:hypothetical protein